MDYDFLDTYGINLVEGRNFSPEFPSDDGIDYQQAGAVILNEEAVRRFGWTDPLGKKVIQTYGDQRIIYKVIGVVSNFHYRSLRQSIEPMNLFLSTEHNRYVSLKLQGEDIPGTLAYIEKTWKHLYPELPPQPWFFFYPGSLFSGCWRPCCLWA